MIQCWVVAEKWNAHTLLVAMEISPLGIQFDNVYQES